MCCKEWHVGPLCIDFLSVGICLQIVFIDFESTACLAGEPFVLRICPGNYQSMPGGNGIIEAWLFEYADIKAYSFGYAVMTAHYAVILLIR